eukprot:13459693-Heterocapsa_arctica.AAC.1
MNHRDFRAEGLLARVGDDPDAVEHAIGNRRSDSAKHLGQRRRLHPHGSHLRLRDRVEEVASPCHARRHGRIPRHRYDPMSCQVESLDIVVRRGDDPRRLSIETHEQQARMPLVVHVREEVDEDLLFEDVQRLLASSRHHARLRRVDGTQTSRSPIARRAALAS